MPCVSCVARGADSERGIDIIVSGMPWATFVPDIQFPLLQAEIEPKLNRQSTPRLPPRYTSRARGEKS